MLRLWSQPARLQIVHDMDRVQKLLIRKGKHLDTQSCNDAHTVPFLVELDWTHAVKAYMHLPAHEASCQVGLKHFPRAFVRRPAKRRKAFPCVNGSSQEIAASPNRRFMISSCIPTADILHGLFLVTRARLAMGSMPTKYFPLVGAHTLGNQKRSSHRAPHVVACNVLGCALEPSKFPTFIEKVAGLDQILILHHVPACSHMPKMCVCVCTYTHTSSHHCVWTFDSFFCWTFNP